MSPGKHGGMGHEKDAATWQIGDSATTLESPKEGESAHRLDVVILPRDEVGRGDDNGGFSLTLAELVRLMDFTITPPEKVKAQLFHWGGVQGLCNQLRVDPFQGLSAAEADDPGTPRRLIYGVNQLPPLILPTLLQHAITALKDVTLIALLAAAAVSLGTGLYSDFRPEAGDEPKVHWIEGFAIFLAVTIIVIVTAVNNWKKDDLLRQQAAEAEDIRISVRRDGDSTDIHVQEILVGDVVLLKDGDIVPIDGLVVESHAGKCDESSATGESDAIKKRPFDLAAGDPENQAEEHDVGRGIKLPVDVVEGPIDFQVTQVPQAKSSSTPFLVQSGTKVNEGTITVVALAVGSNSRYGLLMKEVKKEVEDTPMQKVLARLAASIGWFGLGAALAQLIILTIKLVVKGVNQDWQAGAFDPRNTGVDASISISEVVGAVVNIVIQAVTVIVVAVPEGLPMAVTIALIYGTRKMAERNNFVRQLAACETMGGATTICTDKTGTLTENKMTVVAGFIANSSFERLDIPAISSAMADPPNTVTSVSVPHPSALRLFRSSVFRNSKAFVTRDEHGELFVRGDKTEASLLALCCPQLDRADLKKEREPVEWVFPFSSKKKSMSSVARAGPDCAIGDELYHLYVKGAAEVVLANCSSYVTDNGKVRRFEEDGTDLPKKKEIYHLLDYYAKQCLRCIVSAYQPLSQADYEKMKRGWEATAEAGDEPEVNYDGRLTFIGIVGIEDPLRPGVDIAVRKIQNAGVVVRMVTGDNIVTATSIAMKAGILANGGICMEGPDFRRIYEDHERFHARLEAEAICGDNEPNFHISSVLSDPRSRATSPVGSRREGIITPIMSTDISVDEEVDTSSVRRHIASGQLSQFDKMLPKLRVLARSSPRDKQILVEHLKSLGETVAVTGDGANDGPALKAADVGFAMGIAGSGIAKEAASIILLDDNFVSLVTALVWGRSISESVRKFLTFQLTVNVTAVTLALISSVVDSENESVLTAVQLLWVNLLMDSLGALALATDEPDEEETLSRPPVNNKKEPLITWNMKCMILGEAGVLCGATLLLLYAGPSFFTHLLSGLPQTGPERDYKLRNSIRTAVFNTFVMFNLCNEVNARRIDRKLNVFRGILRNHIFMVILVSTFVIQVIIVQFGSYAFKTVGGLNGYLWMLCIFIGLLAFPVGLFVRIVFFRVTPRAKPVKLDVYPTINPSWKRELLWRRAFRMALKQSSFSRSEDMMTIQLAIPVYNNLKSALDGHPGVETAPAGSGLPEIVVGGTPLQAVDSTGFPTPTLSSHPAPPTLQRRPTVPMLASVVAGITARKAEEEQKSAEGRQ